MALNKNEKDVDDLKNLDNEIEDNAETRKDAKNKKILEKKSKKLKKQMSFFKLIFIYYRIYIWQTLLLIFFILLSSLCASIIPKLTQYLMQKVMNIETPLYEVYESASIIISVFVARGIFTFLNLFIGGRIGKKIEIDLRNKLLANLTKLDMSFYSDKKIGEILTKLISDTEIIGIQSQNIPQSILSAIFTGIGAIIILFTINVKLALVSIALCLIMLITLSIVFAFLKKSIFSVRSTMTSINGDVTNRISNINLIKSFGTETYEEKRFINLHKKYYTVSRKQINIQAFLVAFLVSFLSSINVLVLVVGVILLKNNNLYFTGNLAPGASQDQQLKYYQDGISIVVSAMTGVNTLVLPLMSLSRTFTLIAQASTAAYRVNELIMAKSLINPNTDKKPINSINGNIKFENVTFHYPNRKQKIFDNFSFEFEKGKSYAFVGETGVGKSTISKLLLRFYDPVSGKIFLNNKQTELIKTNLPEYLKHTGYVEQEPSVIAGTFNENIKYGSFKASQEEIIEAAKKAEIHKYIITLKDGYETLIGENGTSLSGGQKQRLVIARMFLKNPDILILDEATSALDNIIEKQIQKNLDKLMINRTTFVIAHRLSTIQNVDYILVLEKNKGIVQIGTFNELVKKPGHFQNLYKAGLMQQ